MHTDRFACWAGPIKKPVSVLLSTVLAASLAFWTAPLAPAVYADASAHASEENVSTLDTPAEQADNANEPSELGQPTDSENAASTLASESEQSPAAVSPLPQAASESAGNPAYTHTATAKQNGVTFTVRLER